MRSPKETVGDLSKTLGKAIGGDIDGAIADLHRIISEQPSFAETFRDGLLAGATLSQGGITPAVDSLLSQMAKAPVAAEGIKTIRTAIGLTQAQLGEKLGGYDRTSVSKWESGSLPMPNKALARFVALLAERGIEDPETVPVPPRISGRGLRQLRQLMGLTPEEFGAKIGVSPITVRLYECRSMIPSPCAWRVAQVAGEMGLELPDAA
jgi:transcriptional regulator with XRE-family HTH domain